jgi:hypothetical protein
MLKSGTINISTNEEKIVKITANYNTIDVNILDKEFINEIAEDNQKISSFRQYLTSLKNFITELKNQKTTVTLSFKGQKVITIGSDAKPILSKLITRTNEIEINSLKTLIQLWTT